MATTIKVVPLGIILFLFSFLCTSSLEEVKELDEIKEMPLVYPPNGTLDSLSCQGNLMSVGEKGCATGKCSCVSLFTHCRKNSHCFNGVCMGICSLTEEGIIIFAIIPIILVLVQLCMMYRRFRSTQKDGKERNIHVETQMASRFLNSSESIEMDALSLMSYKSLGNDCDGAESLESFDIYRHSCSSSTQSSPSSVLRLRKPLVENNLPNVSENEICFYDANEVWKAARNDYIDLEKIEFGPLGIVGVNQDPIIFLETLDKGDTKKIALLTYVTVGLCIFLASFPFPLGFSHFTLDVHHECDESDLSNLSNLDRFACLNLTKLNSHEVYLYASLKEIRISRISTLTQISLDMRDISSPNLKVGFNSIANYTSRIESSDARIQSFNSYLESVLTITCTCLNKGVKVVNGKCIDNMYTCGNVPVFSSMIRDNKVAWISSKEDINLDFSCAFTWNPNLFASILPSKLSLSLYTEGVPYLQAVLIGILSVVNGVVLCIFLWKLCATEDSFSDQIYERKFLLVLLMILTAMQNPVAFGLSFLVHLPTSFLEFVETSDMILLGLLYYFLSMIMDGCCLERTKTKSHLLRVVIFVTLLSFRISMHWTQSPDVIGLVDFGYTFLVATTLLITNICAYRYLSSQPYGVMRLKQLLFRATSILSVMLIASILVITLISFPMNKVAVEHPKKWKSTYVAYVLIRNMTIYLCALLFFPVSQKKQVHGYVYKEIRQYLTTPTGILSQSSRWQRIRQTVVRDIVPYWKPNSMFCVETACRLFNVSRIVYYSPLNAHVPPILQHNLVVLEDHHLEIVGSIFEEITDTYGFILKGNHRLIIAFRGTSSRENIRTDLKLKPVPISDILKEDVWPKDCFVHAGFISVYQRIRDKLHRMVNDCFLDEQIDMRSFQIYTTGHSLGGALATLAALDLAVILEKNVIMYNFGSPRVGDHKFAKFYDKMVPLSFRVVNEGDLVVGQPKSALSFLSGGRRSYKHIGCEVILDGRANGNVLINPSFIEKNLYVQLNRVPQRHLMGHYKIALESVVDLIFNNQMDISRSIIQEDTYNCELPPTSPTYNFLKTRRLENTWQDVLNRLKSPKNFQAAARAT